MLRSLILKLLGLIVSIFPLTLLLIKIIKKGYTQVFSQKERNEPPAILKDRRWNENEGFIRVSPKVKIHYVEKGDKRKPLMLFIHGYPAFWFSWKSQMEHFSKDYHCVAIDMRGYNDSDKPESITEYGVKYLCNDVKAVIEGMGKKQCILVGHDWGGVVGYGFCSTYPEMVTCFIVCNVSHPQSTMHEQENNWRQTLMSWYMFFFQCPIIPEFFFCHDDLNNEYLNDIANGPKDSNPDEVLEAYKYAFRNKSKQIIHMLFHYFRMFYRFHRICCCCHQLLQMCISTS